MPWIRLAALSCCLLAVGATRARAQEGRDVEAPEQSATSEAEAPEPAREHERAPAWRSGFRSFSVGNYIAAGLSGGLALTLSLVWDNPTTPNWTRRNGFDTGVADQLRASRDDAQHRAGIASDVLLWTLTAYPFADALGAALGTAGDGEVALQLALIDAQAHAFAMLLAVVVKRSVARERPFARDCGGPTPHFSCTSADVHQSFYSGHTAMAFTSAGLACAHHRAVDLYSRPRAGRWACAMSMAAAATVGTLRIVADEHYLSDVLVGASVGLLSGFGFATLYHYGGYRWLSGLSGTTSVTAMPMLSRDVLGLSLSGHVDL